MVQSFNIYISPAHFAGRFELSNRVILKLFLGGLRGLSELFTTLKAGNNNYFCNIFKVLNRVIIKLFLSST
jgi:hypothetical protein